MKYYIIYILQNLYNITNTHHLFAVEDR